MGKDDDILARALTQIRKLKEANESLKARIADGAHDPHPQAGPSEPIAIIGLAFRLPSDDGELSSLEELHTFLSRGGDAVRAIDGDRWPTEAFAAENLAEHRNGTSYSHWASQLCAPYHFDPNAFQMTDEEAKVVSPQTRLLLEQCWFALADAGYAKATEHGYRVGLTAGMTYTDYNHEQNTQDLSALDAYTSLSAYTCVDVGRIAYALNLMGPVMLTDTACSSALASVHTAVSCLRTKQADIMLAGASNMILGPNSMASMSSLKGLSPSGRCKTFDADADGYVRGEGVGALVLKRQCDAVRDGDRIIATLCGSAMSCDGHSNGLTAPNAKAQIQIISDALHDAGLTGEAVDYIETHGTGTPIGDPVEVKALATALALSTERSRQVPIGSVKANLGHLEAASGLAGLLKAICCVTRGEVYPQIHFKEHNPRIDWQDVPFHVPTKQQTLEVAGAKKTAGVSSFGISGTNVHVIVQNYAEAQTQLVPQNPGAGAFPLALSARTPELISSYAQTCLNYVQAAPEGWAQLVSSLTLSDQAQSVRRCAMVASKDDMISALEHWSSQNEQSGNNGPGDQTAKGVLAYLAGDLVKWHQLYDWPKGDRPHAPHAVLQKRKLRKACALTAFTPPELPLPFHATRTALAPDGAMVNVRLSGETGLWSGASTDQQRAATLSMTALTTAALCQMGASPYQEGASGFELHDLEFCPSDALVTAQALELQAALQPSDSNWQQAYRVYGKSLTPSAKAQPWYVLTTANLLAPVAQKSFVLKDASTTELRVPFDIEPHEHIGALHPTVLSACLAVTLENLPALSSAIWRATKARSIWVSNRFTAVRGEEPPKTLLLQTAVTKQTEDYCLCDLRLALPGDVSLMTIEGLYFEAVTAKKSDKPSEMQVVASLKPDQGVSNPKPAKPAEQPTHATDFLAAGSNPKARLADFIELQVIRLLKRGDTSSLCRQSGLFSLGLTSLLALELRRQLEDATGLSIDAAATFNFPSIDALAGHLADRLTTTENAKATPRIRADDAPKATSQKQTSETLSPESDEDDFFRQLEDLIAE